MQQQQCSIELVLQRFRSARLLVLPSSETATDLGKAETDDEKYWISIGKSETDNDRSNHENQRLLPHCGLVVYVSFGNGSDSTVPQSPYQKITEAVNAILSIPVITTGVWEERKSTLYSIRQVLQQRQPLLTTSITIIPQANLICKFKNVGKAAIQYHAQVSKDDGALYYSYFIYTLQSELYCEGLQSTTTKDAAACVPFPSWYYKWCKCRDIAPKNATTTKATTNIPDPSIIPNDLFRSMKLYSDDDKEMPMYSSFVEENSESDAGTNSSVTHLRTILAYH